MNKKIKINEVSENEKVLNISDYKCCNRNHISRFNTKERNDVFNYFNSMQSRDQQNEYLKLIVRPVDVVVRKAINSRKTQSFEYYIKINDKTNNIEKEVQVCKRVYLKLHQIQESRLRKNVYENREQNKDMRGHHQYKHNTIPLEVENERIH